MIFETGESYVPKERSAIEDYDLEEILQLTDGMALLEGEYRIDFIPQGAGEFKALCPLPTHNEKSASFYYNPTNRGWRCYGCSQKGGLIKLVMKIEGCSFNEAVYKLAEQAGYEPVTDPEMKLDKTSRAVTRFIGDYMSQQSSALPGQVSPLKFMATVREKMDRVMAMFPGDRAVILWTEDIYMKLDDLLLDNNFKGCRALWDGISDEVIAIKRRMKEVATNG